MIVVIDIEDRKVRKLELRMKEYVCVDLETTGLSPKENEIIEIGAVRVINNEVVEVFSELIRPSVSIPSRITMITGISNSMVKNKDDITKVLPRFIKFLGGLPIIAHNINFDYGFLLEKASKQKITLDCMGVDTLRIARGLMQELSSKSLASLCEHYNVINANAHRASDDAIATVKIFECMKKDYIEDYPEMFAPRQIGYKVKKIQSVTSNQKEQLASLLNKHQIKIAVTLEEVDRPIASKLINYITQYYER
jgi:DNA polymerase-3 subunit alpha (Gram-positive type)